MKTELLQTTLAFALFTGWVTLHAATQTHPQGKTQHLNSPDQVPPGLGAADWSGIRAEYERYRHTVRAVEGQKDAWQARNPGQKWLTIFDSRGFLAQPDSAPVAGSPWRWGLELKSYGFAGHEHAVENRAAVTTEKDRVTYKWDSILSEWFVNDKRGLEHGFTIHQRPARLSNLNSPSLTPLRFTLAVRGGLRPVVERDGRDDAPLNDSTILKGGSIVIHK